MSRTRGGEALALATLALLAGCGSPAPSKGSQKSSPQPTSGSSAETGTEKGRKEIAITAKEAEEFSKRIAKTISNGDPSVFGNAFDTDSLAAAIASGLQLKPALFKEFSEGLSENGLDTAKAIVEGCRGGSYELIRVRMVEGKPRPLFRMLAKGPLTYHELRLGRDDRNQIRITDFYSYATGELISESLRRNMLPLLVREQPDLATKLPSLKIESKEAMELQTRMFEQINEGQHSQALATFGRLPESMRKSKGVLICRLKAARSVSEEEYKKALSDLAQHCSGDSSISLILVEWHFIQGKFDEVLKDIDAFEKSIGGDAYLGLLRWNAYIQTKRYQNAEQVLRDAIKTGPDRSEYHENLMDTLAVQRKFGEVVAEMRHLNKVYRMNFPNLEQRPTYREFVQSQEYKNYLRDGK